MLRPPLLKRAFSAGANYFRPASASNPHTHLVLTYSYAAPTAAALAALRAPHREAHRAYCSAHPLLTMGGALQPPPEAPAPQGLLVFRTSDRAEVEAFAKADPYVKQGVVAAWAVREWTVVVEHR